MGDFGDEFLRVDRDAVALDGSVIRGLVPNNATINVATQNTRSLIRMLAKLQVAGGVIAIPGRRFYLGPVKGATDSEVRADIVIPDRVQLWFVPDGQLVPISIAPGAPGYPVSFRPGTEPDPADPDPRYRVKFEIQGSIEAGIFQIFDVFLEAPNPRISPTTPAGTVVFTRHGVSALYPEWWGAVPWDGDPGAIRPGAVRRTTAALQACLDAAHRSMRDPNASGASTPRPPLPVVLTNSYVIDDELSVGVPRAEVDMPRSARDATWAPYNNDGIVIRGACGPASGGAANVWIRAWPDSPLFREEPPGGASDFPSSPGSYTPSVGRVVDGNRPTYGYRSLLGIRGVFGATVKDVGFDGGVASRCVTLESVGAPMHHVGFEGCAFTNARAELVHVGGELRSPPEDSRTGAFLTLAGSSRWEGSQDLSNLRFLRCSFRTSLAVPSGVASMPSRCAVFTRASQSLGVGFEGCSFAGPANPMVHLTSGRYAFDGCHFRAEVIDGAEGGLDILLDHR